MNKHASLSHTMKNQYRFNPAALVHLISKGLEYCREEGIDVFEGLLTLGGVVVTVFLLVAGVAVALVLLVGISFLMIWIVARIIKWNKGCRVKNRYGRFNPFLTSQNQIIKRNARLGALFVTSAKIGGDSVPKDVRTVICRSKRSATALSFQLQSKYCGSLWCAHVTLEQVGKDVVARTDWVAHASSDCDVGYDFSSEYSWANDLHDVPPKSDGPGVFDLRFRGFSRIKACCVPTVVYKGGKHGRWLTSGLRDEVLKVDSNYSSKDSRDGAACIKVELAAGDGRQREIVWRDPVNDGGDKIGGANLSKANELVFRVRGERGGERVWFFMGGLKERMVFDTADECAINVCLKKKWKTYRILLHDVDLTRVKTAFGVRINGGAEPMAIFVDNVAYQYSLFRSIMFGVKKVCKCVVCAIKCLCPFSKTSDACEQGGSFNRKQKPRR